MVVLAYSGYGFRVVIESLWVQLTVIAPSCSDFGKVVYTYRLYTVNHKTGGRENRLIVTTYVKKCLEI